MRKIQNPYQERMNEMVKSQSEKSKKKDNADKKNPNKIVINVSECQYSIVRTVAKKLKWNIVNEPVSTLNFDLCWVDGHARQQIFARMQPYQKINHFPGMEILSRKNQLGKSLMQFKRKFPEQYDFFPLTWNLPTQFSDLKAYHDNRQQGKAQTFIVKPENGCQGRGIFLTRHIQKLKYDKCVVQRYMHKPLLIDGLKFDLRIYVLLAGIDPLRIFVYEQGLARFCTQQYEPPKSDNLDNHFMHLTNYAINKLSPDFEFNEDAKGKYLVDIFIEADKGHKRSLTSIYKTLEEMGHNSLQIKGRIDDMIIKTIITGHPTLSRMQQSSHPQNFANDMCFEILGFDVFLNHKLQPSVIQINYTPSFSVDTPFDKSVKKNLIYDTLKIMNISQKWKKQVRKKRQLQIKERMFSGKRLKYTQQERNVLIQKYSKLRDEHEAQNLGAFRKVFCQSEEQMFKYAHYYEFAQSLYQKQNKITGVGTSKSYIPFYMPFVKTPKSPSTKQFVKTVGFSSTKMMNRKHLVKQDGKVPKSIENKKILAVKNLQARTPPLNSISKNQKIDRNSKIAKSLQEQDILLKNNLLQRKLSKQKQTNTNTKVKQNNFLNKQKRKKTDQSESSQYDVEQEHQDNNNDDVSSQQEQKQTQQSYISVT